MDQEQIKRYRIPIIVGIFVFSILINGGFFPIVNFNPNNPVKRETIMLFIIIVMSCAFHKEVGSLEAVILSECPPVLIGVINVAIVLCALVCRYLLELGEVSNTYHFTAMNIAFQMIFLALISSVTCLLERKKQ